MLVGERNIIMKQIKKNHPEYIDACLAWNRAVTKYPNIITFCQTEADVRQAILSIQTHNLPFAIRSGRHHYEGASSCDNGYVIDVSSLQTISIDELKQTVTIGGGVRNRELYESLAEKGYPFPGGGCPSVGVAGFTIGGGWGYSSRLFGLGCDSLQSITLITFDGKTICIDKDHYSDLFWAIRGGGNCEIGIITSLTYALPEKQACATHIFLDIADVTHMQAIHFMIWYQQWFKTLPREINLKTVVYTKNGKNIGIKITGLSYADKQKTQTILDVLVNQLSFETIYFMDGPVIKANRAIQDSHPDWESYTSAGRFSNGQMTESDWQECLELLLKVPIESSYAAFTLYGLGGAIQDVPNEATAFAFRHQQFILGMQIVWEDDAKPTHCYQWFKSSWFIIYKMTSGSFINFPTSLQNEAEYYGQNWTKFQSIRTKYQNV